MTHWLIRSTDQSAVWPGGRRSDSIKLFFQAVKLTNMIIGDEANHDLDPSDAVCLASKELYGCSK